ncbi:MAG: hypothetical protein RSE60_07770 [Erysipelotrichaceae bacterium]
MNNIKKMAFMIFLALQIINFSDLKDEEKICEKNNNFFLSKKEQYSQDLWDDIIKLTTIHSNVNIF